MVLQLLKHFVGFMQTINLPTTDKIDFGKCEQIFWISCIRRNSDSLTYIQKDWKRAIEYYKLYKLLEWNITGNRVILFHQYTLML